jgi:hypothetical protein
VEEQLEVRSEEDVLVCILGVLRIHEERVDSEEGSELLVEEGLLYVGARLRGNPQILRVVLNTTIIISN